MILFCFSGFSLLNQGFTYEHIHRLTITSSPLTGDINNIDYFLSMAFVKWWDMLCRSEQFLKLMF